MSGRTFKPLMTAVVKFFETLHASKGFEVDGNKLKIYYGDNAEHWMEFEDKT